MRTLLLAATLITCFVFNSSHASASGTYCQNESVLPTWPRWPDGQVSAMLSQSNSVDQIVVSKKFRQLYLFRGGSLLKSYNVAFGLNPVGPKQFLGDNKTPEGLYSIEAKNPRSAYYLSLRVSYPNAEDTKNAAALGRSAGGDIMIHGYPKDPKERAAMLSKHPKMDWTQGCIAVTDQEITEIFNVVMVGAAIEICPSETAESAALSL